MKITLVCSFKFKKQVQVVLIQLFFIDFNALIIKLVKEFFEMFEKINGTPGSCFSVERVKQNDHVSLYLISLRQMRHNPTTLEERSRDFYQSQFTILMSLIFIENAINYTRFLEISDTREWSNEMLTPQAKSLLDSQRAKVQRLTL